MQHESTITKASAATTAQTKIVYRIQRKTRDGWMFFVQHHDSKSHAIFHRASIVNENPGMETRILRQTITTEIL